MSYMKIGEVARKAGVNIDTVRYYERKNLIPEPPRRESGYRQYTMDTVRRIHFIRKAKELGFSLKEITELLSLRVSPDTACADMKKHAETKITDIEAKISMLNNIKDSLKELTEMCTQNRDTGECPILEALDTGYEDK